VPPIRFSQKLASRRKTFLAGIAVLRTLLAQVRFTFLKEAYNHGFSKTKYNLFEKNVYLPEGAKNTFWKT